MGRGWCIVGFGFGLACSTPAGFACQDASECTLGGRPGVCADTGNCAYPSDGCESGFAYPTGAPGGLAGACADVDDPGTSTASSSGAITTMPRDDSGTDGGTTTLALDDTTTGGADPGGTGTDNGDDATTSVGLSTDSGTGTEDGETSSCGSVQLELPAIADVFLVDQCSGMASCEDLNYGGSEAGFIGLENPFDGQSVMLLRFDATEFFDSGAVVLSSATLELTVSALGANGSLAVASLDGAANWMEGDHAGELPSNGEVTWLHLSYPDELWPDGTPTMSTVSVLGEIGVDPPVPDGTTIQLELDVGTLINDFVAGHQTMLVGGDGLFHFLARESGEAPVLRLVGC